MLLYEMQKNLNSIPVFIKPIIDLSLGVDRISKVRRSWRSNPELSLLCAKYIIDKLLVLSFIILLYNAEVSLLLC